MIRGRRSSAERYEHDTPGGLIHVDVKKLGKNPDGGGWRVHGRGETARGRGIGYDFVHSVVDDHCRRACSEIHDDERGETCTAFMARALAFFASHGIAVEPVMTDNHLSYKRTASFAALLADRGVKHVFIKPHCPWTNGKASNGSTAHCSVSGPTAGRSPATPSAGKLWHRGCTTTTTSAGTSPSEATRRSVECQRPSGSLQQGTRRRSGGARGRRAPFWMAGTWRGCGLSSTLSPLMGNQRGLGLDVGARGNGMLRGPAWRT